MSRAGWGARRPRRVGRMRTPVNMVFVHHTAGGFCSSRSACIRQMRNIQRFHMDSRREFMKKCCLFYFSIKKKLHIEK